MMRGCPAGTDVFAWPALCSLCCALRAPRPGTTSHLPDRRLPPAPRGSEITVGSFDFPESVLLAHVYADALAARGFPVRVIAGAWAAARSWNRRS